MTPNAGSSLDAPAIDLVSPSSFIGDQPHDQYAWLREHSPVHFHPETEGSGFWAVTRYEDVKAVGRDTETFTSSPTIMLADPSDDQDNALGDHAMMLMTDPPVHTRMRRFISQEFTPKQAQAMRPRIQELAAGIVDEVIERGECDLVTDLAGEMPSFVIAEMLGIPLADGRDLYHHTEALHSSEDAVGRETRAAAFGEMFAYSQQVWADKRANPADDLATMLAHGEIDGTPLDPIDFFLWFLLLVDAGGDTTRNLVGGGMWALFNDPAHLDQLTNDRSIMPTAIEELLRWTSPVIHMRRTATRDTELGGQAIAEGDKVVIFYGAANRDPRAFERADELDLTRSPNPHVAFGGGSGGPHFCLGAHLARVEIGALLDEMLRRLGNLQLAGEPTWMQSNFIYGPTSMPVTFTPAARRS